MTNNKELWLHVKGYRKMYDGNGSAISTNYFFVPGNPGKRISLEEVSSVMGVNPGLIQLVHNYYLTDEHFLRLRERSEGTITEEEYQEKTHEMLRERRKIITNLLFPLKIKWMRDLGCDPFQEYYVLESCTSQLLQEKEILAIKKNCKIGRILIKKWKKELSFQIRSQK